MLNSSKDILFITGAFMSHHCWDEWKLYFDNNGFTTEAPPWPYKDAPSEVLRKRHPDTDVARTRLSDLISHYGEIAKSFSEKPIIIGHSMGGLIAQLLLQKDLAVAAIAIHSVPPQGIMTFKFSFLKAGWGPLGFFTSSKKTFMMSFSQWQYGFANGISEEWQEKAYCDFVIPESKLVVRDTITSVAKVDFNKEHAPLLLIAGSIDRSIPSSLNYENYKKYSDKTSITRFVEFTGRNHFVLGQPGWEEVALLTLNWIKNPSMTLSETVQTK
tara:strand:+ start:17180 stop:17992 length:813 start_codon:yes stop_codon:yes gene_type:complete